MTNPEAFRVYHTPESRPHGRKRWMMLRQSVADAPRRAEVCAAVNDRYLGTFADAKVDTPAGPCAAPVCQRVTKKRRRYRALNPWSPGDAALLQTIARGEYTLHGFRNRDLRAALLPATKDRAERHRQAGRVTRLLALLRAHRVVRKVTGTHRYIVTAIANLGRFFALLNLVGEHPKDQCFNLCNHFFLGRTVGHRPSQRRDLSDPAPVFFLMLLLLPRRSTSLCRSPSNGLGHQVAERDGTVPAEHGGANNQAISFGHRYTRSAA